MRIGIGLPNPVPGTTGPRLVEWARRAEECGFESLATVDRIAYPSHDSLATLAAAAAVTERIELVTNILLAPAYQAALLAKTTATVDQISGGRLILGLGVGNRPDDSAAAGRDYSTRGRDLDEMVDLLHRSWSGEAISGGELPSCARPVRDDQIPLMFGGYTEKAIERVVKWGIGWTCGTKTPTETGEIMQKVRDAWREADREGSPRFSAPTYYSLGGEVEAESRAYLNHFYEHRGPIRADEWPVRSAADIRETVRQYEAVGVTDLYLNPTASSLDQVDRLADVVFG